VAVVTHAVGLPLIFPTAFVTAAGSALRDTAAEASVPRIVPAAHLDRANGRLVAGQIVGNELAGPAVGGWLFGVAAALPFALNAGALGVAILLLLTLPSMFQPLPEAGAEGIWRELRAGAAWLRRDARIRAMVIAGGVISAVDAMWFAVLVLYVAQVLRQPDSAYGLLLAAGAVGGVAAGATAARITKHVGPGWYVLVMAATQLGLALTTDVFAGAVLLAVSSAAFALFNVVAVGMRQRLVPPAMLGRVGAIYRTVGRGSEAVGALAGGLVAAAAGIRAPLLVGVIPLLAVAWVLSRIARER
jgi:predicted MFS family arabinose efflux permease